MTHIAPNTHPNNLSRYLDACARDATTLALRLEKTEDPANPEELRREMATLARTLVTVTQCAAACAYAADRAQAEAHNARSAARRTGPW